VWSSDGSGSYEIEEADGQRRGSKLVIELKDDCADYAQDWKIKEILERYSAFVSFPINLNGKRINTIQALWLRSRNEIKEEEYTEFYKFQSHAHDDPRLRLHFSADAPLSINALLFVPKDNTEKLGFARLEASVALYCRKVLIDAKPKDLLPEWLRFLKGVVDSEDLPLNISRETMQDTSLMQKLNKALTSRFLKFLNEQSEQNPETYDKFYDEYHRFLKEGVVTDFTHREALGKLLRYESSSTEKGKRTSLADYVKRMPEEQKEIYCLMAPNREAAESSPYFEVFRERKFEVLFLYDEWDEFVTEHLHTFEGKTLKPAEKADLNLNDPKKDGALSEEAAKALAAWIKESLGERVGEVRASQRLVDSPAVIVDADRYMTSSMRRMLKAMKKDESEFPAEKQDLEINPAHPIIARLDQMRQKDASLAGQVAEQILDNARVAAGVLEDPRTMLKRMNQLLERVLA